MIRILNVEIKWIDATTWGKRGMIYDGGIIVNYSNGEVKGHVNLDLPESEAMNLTLNEIRERVVLKLREVQ